MTNAGKANRSLALLISAFSVALSLVFAQGLNGQRDIYVRGRSDRVEEARILRTGTMLPVDTPARTAPDVYPSLDGSYTSSAQHPRVFITPTDMSDLVTRINTSGSFSAQSFASSRPLTPDVIAVQSSLPEPPRMSTQACNAVVRLQPAPLFRSPLRT